MPQIDYTGRVFGRLTVLSDPGVGNSTRMLPCRCSCGKKVSVRAKNLAAGHSRSCGCMRKNRKRSPREAFTIR